MSAPSNPSDLSSSVDALFAEWDRPDSPGCVVAVVREGEIIYQRGFGMANLEYDVPNDPGTIYHVASISKQFTAFAVHLLASDGKLNLDDDVRKYVPELADFGSPISLRHLIHHTSGLRDQWNLLGLAGWRSGDVITEEDILKMTWRQTELNSAPGNEFNYCNTGYTLLGLIVKRIAGTSLREFCQERMFSPLGMIHTYFHDDNTEIVKGRAYSYGPMQGGGFKSAPLQYANVGATSLFTTVGDLALWDRNFDEPKVGGQSLIAEMHKGGVLNDGTQLEYASGLINGHYRGIRTVGHDGADAGFRTSYLRFPEQQLSVVLLANLSSINPSRLVQNIADIYMADVLSPAEAPKTDSPSQPAEFNLANEMLREYVGSYYSRELGVINDITEGDSGLVMSFPKGLATLQPFEKDVFHAHPIGQMTFERVDGTLTGFRLDNGRVRRLLFESWRSTGGSD